jgi:hypothetical protein
MSEHLNTNSDGLQFAVAPSINGAAYREVCVNQDGKLIYCDKLDVWKAKSRQQFLEAVAPKTGRPVAELLDSYDTRLIELAQQADADAEAEADAQASETETDLFEIAKRELENTPADVLEAAKQMAQPAVACGCLRGFTMARPRRRIRNRVDSLACRRVACAGHTNGGRYCRAIVYGRELHTEHSC